jgi:hypothetical protein
MRRSLIVLCLFLVVACKKESATNAPQQEPASSPVETTSATTKQPLAANDSSVPTKTVTPVSPLPVTVSPDVFVGRWKLVNDKGVVSSFLNVTTTGAMRDHAPDYPGKWEVVGNEARFTWDDGFRDVLRFEGGKMTMMGLGKVGDNWDSPPEFHLQAIRIGPAKMPHDVIASKPPSKPPEVKPSDLKPAEVKPIKEPLPEIDPKRTFPVQVADIQVGVYGRAPGGLTEYLKLLQVVDADHMIVGLDATVMNRPKNEAVAYRRFDELCTRFMLVSSTAGLTETGKACQWKDLIGDAGLVCTGTTTYKTAAGGSKTVFTLELLTRETLQKVLKAKEKIESKNKKQ